MTSRFVEIKGNILSISALSTGRALYFSEKMSIFSDKNIKEFVRFQCDVITESLRYEHKDLKGDFVQKSLKDDEITAIFSQVLELSGLIQKETSSGKDMDWNEVVAYICACTGWTPRQIDNDTTLDEIKYLNDYYRQSPPTHLLMAAYIGYKPEKATKQTVDDFKKQNKEHIAPKGEIEKLINKG